MGWVKAHADTYLVHHKPQSQELLGNTNLSFVSGFAFGETSVDRDSIVIHALVVIYSVRATTLPQVDRSAAYAARWVAKSLVHAGLCHRVLVQLSYAIGVPYPLSIHVDSYGTAKTRSGKSDEDLVEIINNNFDLRPGCLLRDLQLRRPIFQKTAAYGHFGRKDADFTWEAPKDLTL